MSNPVFKHAIAQICFSNSWGGLEMSSVKMTRLFKAAGHPSFEICSPDSPIHAALTEQGLEAIPLAGGRYVNPRTTLAIRRLIRARGVRAVYVHALKDLWLVTPALAGLDDVRLYGFARMFLKDVNKKGVGHRLIYRRVDRLIALSHLQKAYLRRCLPVPDEKFTVIPNGVDTERFRPRPRRDDLRREWGVREDHVLFGLVGRLDLQKGSLEFVEAAARVLTRHPNARFVLVGENTHGEGEFDARVRARVAELGLGDRVVLTPFRRDVPAVLNALDVFVMPSYEENFGNVLLEALSSGLPAIGTDSGGTPEILSAGEVGLLCQPRSAEDLARAMNVLLDEPARAADFARRARAKAESEYDMDVVFGRIRALAEA